jgi:hypothetical protein
LTSGGKRLGSFTQSMGEPSPMSPPPSDVAGQLWYDRLQELASAYDSPHPL